MGVNVPGIVAIAVFYIIITVVGIYFGRRSNKTGTLDELFLANRKLGLFVTSLTLSATGIGGGFVLGTTEIIGKAGFVWCAFPISNSVAMCICAVVFIPKIFGEGYTTILDPIQIKYGHKMGAILSIPELLGDLFWLASIFTALGSTLSSVLGINIVMATIVSAGVTTGYTIFGGLYSVAYTDVLQSGFIVCGLVLALSFSINHPAVDLQTVKETWYGSVPLSHTGRYLDMWLMLVLGATTFQALYQRMLATKTKRISQFGSVFAALIMLAVLVPTAVIGVIGKATDWNMTDFEGHVPLRRNQWTALFPMVLEYLCPPIVSIIGIGTLSAAVMSSADSAILAAGSILTHNIYGKLVRPNSSSREMVFVLRVSFLIVGILGTVMSISVRSVYGLLIIITDISYVVQFPQLCCVLWVPFSNVYGSIAGIISGFLLRILGGEPLLNFPAVIKYPFYNAQLGQLFPFKSLAMALSFLTIVSVSYFTRWLFKYTAIDSRYDILKCFQKEARRVVEINMLADEDKDTNEQCLTKTDETMPIM